MSLKKAVGKANEETEKSLTLQSSLLQHQNAEALDTIAIPGLFVGGFGFGVSFGDILGDSSLLPNKQRIPGSQLGNLHTTFYATDQLSFNILQAGPVLLQMI